MQLSVPCLLSVHGAMKDRLDDRENTVFCAPVLCGAHDGWERQHNEINRLETAVCTTCAVRDSVLHEVA